MRILREISLYEYCTVGIISMLSRRNVCCTVLSNLLVRVDRWPLVIIHYEYIIIIRSECLSDLLFFVNALPNCFTILQAS